MDKKVTKRDMMLDDDIDELEDTEDILAALRDFFEEDPLLKAFFNGMKNDNQGINMNDYIEQFIENNPDLPGMERFSKLMKRGPLPDHILEVENMVSEQRKSYDETDWLDDRQRYFALDALLTAYIHTIRIYEDHCMYKSAILCAFDALEICEDVDDKFEFLSVIMHNYAQIQDVDHAEELYQAISKTESEMDADILLPFSVLYFTLGNYQRSFEVLSELVMNNEDTIDFILDWEEGSECIDEKMNDYMDFYGEGYFTYDTFADIWENYADFYRDRKAYFDWAISLYEPSEA